MNPETAETRLDGMQVHPDWNHIETLTISPDSDTLVIVPSEWSLKASVDFDSPAFDPLIESNWSFGEDNVCDPRFVVEQTHTGVLSVLHIPRSVLVLSGGFRGVNGEERSAGESFYAVGDFYDWWRDELDVSLHVMKSKIFVDVFAFDVMDSLYISSRLFQLSHPRQEVPKKVVVVDAEYRKELFEVLAGLLHIPELEFIGLPRIVSDEILEKEQRLIASYKADPFGEQLDSFVTKEKMLRNPGGVVYPYGNGLEVRKSYKKQFEHRKASHSQ